MTVDEFVRRLESRPPGPAASYALGWIDTALALEAENAELRRLMSALLVAIARNQELVEYARCQLEASWLDEATAA